MRQLFAAIVVLAVLALASAASAAPARAELTECEACELVAALAEAALQMTHENTTAVEAFLNKLCNDTGKYDAECEMVLMLYVDGIVTALESGEPAVKFCTDSIPLCTGNTSSIFAHAPTTSNTTMVCEVCEYLVAGAEFIVTSGFFGNLTAAEVVLEMENMCSLMGDLSAECNIAVETFGTEIVDGIFDGSSTEQVCSDVYACSATNSLPLMELRPINTVESNGTITCYMCDYLVDGLEKVINSGLLGNVTFDGALHFLEELCGILGSRAAECDDVVETFGAQIVYELLNNAAPSSVCTTVHACSNNDTPVVTIGHDRIFKFQLLARLA